MLQTGRSELVQGSVARAGLFVAVSLLRATHSAGKIQGEKAPVVPHPNSSPQHELSF